MKRLSSLARLQSRTKSLFSTTRFTSDVESRPKANAIETIRLIDGKGELLDKSLVFADEELQTYRKILQTMIELEAVDDIMNKSQRQGRISFYMTSLGETATVVGTAAALDPSDMLFTQYREMGALYHRGFSIQEITDNCVCNARDIVKGRQMPIHFSCAKRSFFSISSPLGTQIPQAAGYGYGLRVRGERTLAAAYFGEGCASEGDFYAGLNFAQTLKSQMLFVCRNNFYAISTPISEQTSGDNILPKALAFGMEGARVDGNDAVAVYRLTRRMREHIMERGEPAFIEALTYRVGNHSTSDDSTYYRKAEEIDQWKTGNYPVDRLANFLRSQGVVDDAFMAEMEEKRVEIKKETAECLKRSTAEKLPSIESMFEDVYDKVPKHLQLQRQELLEHVERHKEEYEKDYQLSRHIASRKP